jgi:hypothetical protein
MPAKHKSSSPHLVDPDEAPEITEAWVRGADLYEGDKLVRRGRPPRADPQTAGDPAPGPAGARPVAGQRQGLADTRCGNTCRKGTEVAQ